MKNLQNEIKQFCRDNSMEAPIEHRVLDLFSELGDALYSLITVANYFDIDLEEAVKGALAKYKRRLQKGSAGSESD